MHCTQPSAQACPRPSNQRQDLQVLKLSALAAAEADEEECGAQFTPIVQLQEVATSTGEEAEEAKFERSAPTRRALSACCFS